MYVMTTSARSTSSRSTSSRRISVRSRSNGPAKTSRSSSRSRSATPQTLSAMPDRSYPHRFPHVDHRVGGYRAGLGRPVGQDRLELPLVGPKLPVTLPGGRQIGGHGLGHGLLEVTV